MKAIASVILGVLLLLLLVGCVPAGVGMGGLPVTPTTWTAILAFVAPLIIVGIQQLGFTKVVNSLLALGITIGIAVLDAWYFGRLNSGDLPGTVLTILSGAYITYMAVWKPLGVIDWWAEKTTLKRFSMERQRLGIKPRGLPW